MKKEISIIIPALNEKASLNRLLPYLEKHNSGYVKEIIVVDGGSSDNTRETARQYGAVVIESEKKGRAFQMNRGAEKAASSILYFLHADTFPPEHFDDKIINQIKKGADSGCFTLQFDDSHRLLKFYSFFTRFKTTLVRFGDQSLFITKELFNKTGGFDESLIVMEDQKIVRECKKYGSFSLVRDPVLTSARKYKVNGVLKLQIIFIVILIGYYFGAKQETLQHIYKNLIRSK